MPNHNNITIGLDIGGANLKAATARGAARSHPFELWKHPEKLGVALVDLLKGWQPARLAVTMTGELCDCFTTKRDGVNRILAQVEEAFPGIEIGVWSTGGRFVSVDEARRNPLAVAAANWHALARIVDPFKHLERILLIDVGSTTTDIILIKNGKPASKGLTDFDRLRSQELVYTGTRRTPVCALIQEGIMAEFFATTLDVYLRLGMIADEPENCQTADGRPATVAFAHCRLARMLGGDGEIISEHETDQLALRVFEMQKRLLADAFLAVIGRESVFPDGAIFSGSGEFLARAAWREFAQDRAFVFSLTDDLGAAVSGAACAHAIAVLAEQSWLA
jgi:probable H4MPT-linked C1 transfer pathway protein